MDTRGRVEPDFIPGSGRSIRIDYPEVGESLRIIPSQPFRDAEVHGEERGDAFMTTFITITPGGGRLKHTVTTEVDNAVDRAEITDTDRLDWILRRGHINGLGVGGAFITHNFTISFSVACPKNNFRDMIDTFIREEQGEGG